MRLGIIGFGEVGFEMAKGYKGEGLDGIIVYDVLQDHPVYGALVKERVEISGVTIVGSPEEVLQKSNVVIVAVPGSKALETARGLCGFLQKDTLYVDVSASSPAVKQGIWEEIKGSLRFDHFKSRHLSKQGIDGIESFFKSLTHGLYRILGTCEGFNTRILGNSSQV